MSLRPSIIAATTLLASPALAGGLAEPVYVPAPAAPVTIVTPPAPVASTDWSGFYVGGGLSYGEIDSDDFDESGDGENFGVHAGYQHDFGPVVLGGELEYDWSNMGIDDLDVDVDNIARAKLRVGYDAGRVLPYLTAGVARASLSGALEDDVDGRFYGAGAEFMATERISVGAEVLRHQFDDVAGTDDSADVTTFGLRASFRF